MGSQSTPEFQGWLGHSPDAINGKMEWGAFEPKKWTEDDVDIEISHCGICGSDLHSMSSRVPRWGSAHSPWLLKTVTIGWPGRAVVARGYNLMSEFLSVAQEKPAAKSRNNSAEIRLGRNPVS